MTALAHGQVPSTLQMSGWLASIPRIAREDAMSGHSQEFGMSPRRRAHAA
jgi:hypothetical protein